MRTCVIVPAYQAERTIEAVVRAVVDIWPNRHAVFVVDDGSTDATARRAKEAGAEVLRLPANRGKGFALRHGMAAASEAGFDAAVSMDADGQHLPEEALRLATSHLGQPEALLLGVRDLEAAGAPRANQISNRISNVFLSFFARRPFADTQCGLRRYPLPKTLELGGRDPGYAFEAEIILRAVAGGLRILEVPVKVHYPPEDQRVTHFHSVRDPARIVRRVVHTLIATRGLHKSPLGAAAPDSAMRGATTAL